MYQSINKYTKIKKGISIAVISLMAALISQFIVWGLEYALLKGLTNEEKEELEFSDYVSTVFISLTNGFLSVFIRGDAFLFVASINSIIISNLVFYYFNNELSSGNLIEELLITILTVFIVFKVVLKLFDNSKIKRKLDNTNVSYLIMVNIILNLAITFDFSIYNLLFDFNNTRSNVFINESVDI